MRVAAVGGAERSKGAQLGGEQFARPAQLGVGRSSPQSGRPRASRESAAGKWASMCMHVPAKKGTSRFWSFLAFSVYSRVA